MKANSFKAKPYSQLIRKLFLQSLAVLGCSCAFVLVLRYLTRGKLANRITDMISIITNNDWETSMFIYRRVIGNRLEGIMIILVVLFFFLFFRLLLSWFTRYFDEIVDGVEILTQETDKKIAMSSELFFVEEKLNEVKDTLKRRSEEVAAAEQRKNDLVVYLAHDIKTPLTSVIGYLSLLDESSGLPEELRSKYTSIALEKSHRLEVLINEFFEITRYNLDSIPLDKESANLCYMMVQLSDELYPLLSSAGKDISIGISDEIDIWGDSEKLARVFNNILKNAISYSAPKSTITVSAYETEESLIISFKNEGSIPQNRLDSIFEKFYRLDDARSSGTGGSGLGLAIAKDIVTLHGGEIKAESIDGYTEFSLWLPKKS